jgi:hypothetical protein
MKKVFIFMLVTAFIAPMVFADPRPSVTKQGYAKRKTGNINYRNANARSDARQAYQDVKKVVMEPIKEMKVDQVEATRLKRDISTVEILELKE